MHSGRDSAEKPVAKVLIVCLKTAEAGVHKIVEAQAARGWGSQGQISILPINDHFSRYRDENSARINKAAPRQTGARVVILGKVEHREVFGKARDNRSLNTYASLLELREGLPAILRQSSLDWQSDTVGKLYAYDHGVIDPRHVEMWLNQFERFGVSWIGERLLRCFDFWPPARLIKVLGLSQNELSAFDCICVNRKRIGKSADVLSNLLKKHIRSLGLKLPIEDFHETFSDQKRIEVFNSILFVEDCLLTGTEMTNFFHALLNEPHPSGRKLNMPCLPDPKTLWTKRIQLRFPVSTSLGVFRLNDFIKRRSLENVVVTCLPEGQIEVLTAAGQVALREGVFFDPDTSVTNCPNDAGQHIAAQAFRGDWGNSGKDERAKQFCAAAGSQLFELYLQKMGWPWPRKKREPCCFGMLGLGLVLAFAHSVPKASLPLFWMDGPVKWDGRTLDWTALFPNAAF
jgi:hypothetical protein